MGDLIVSCITMTNAVAGTSPDGGILWNADAPVKIGEALEHPFLRLIQGALKDPANIRRTADVMRHAAASGCSGEESLQQALAVFTMNTFGVARLAMEEIAAMEAKENEGITGEGEEEGLKP